MSNAYTVTFLFLLAQLTPPHTLHHLKPLILWPILYSPDKLKKLIFIHHNGSLTHAPTPQQSPSFNTLRKLFRLLSCSVMACYLYPSIHSCEEKLNFFPNIEDEGNRRQYRKGERGENNICVFFLDGSMPFPKLRAVIMPMLNLPDILCSITGQKVG